MTGGTRILDLLVLALALVGGLTGIAAWKRQSAQALARTAFLLALGAAASSWVVRWVLAGHLPLFGTYESGISLSLIILLVAACLGVGARRIAALAWPVAWLLNFSLSFPQVAKAIGLNLSGIAKATAVPLLGGLPMAAAIALTRMATPNLADPWRLPLLIAVGSLVYLGVVTALKPSVWVDVRRTLAAARG